MTPEPRRIAVVTGGSSGIGRAVARELLTKGCAVAICGRRKPALDDALAELATVAPRDRILTHVCDLEQAGAAEAFVDRAGGHFGGLDVLVNNAGWAANALVTETTEADFAKMWHVNVGSVFFSIRAAWKWLQDSSSGTIINISSMAAVDPFPGFAVYGACKAWVDLFTQALAAEGKPHNICVFSVRPGAVETPLLRGLFPEFPEDQALEASSVADVVSQLLDPAFRNSSGMAIPVRRQ